jgi:hypothetical protein
MAIIPINSEWQLKSEPRNWILQRKTSADDPTDDESSEPGWKSIGYYCTLADAVIGMVNREIRVPADVKGVLAKLDELYALINERFAATPAQVDELEDFLQ